MAPKLDLSLALKLVRPFDGSVTELTRYIESVELLKDYADDVPEAAILKFLKTTLVGAAHGAIDNAATIALALQVLRQKFAIRVTPRAMENEINTQKQGNKSISDYGAEIEKLTAKLAAAHVSTGTFASEAAAANIVEPIAVQAFTNGLKDPATKFFIKARNPATLNKAISDALECQVTPGTSGSQDNMMALWCTSGRPKHHHRGPGRGFQSNRGFSNNYDNYNRGRGNLGRGYHQPQYESRGRGFHQNPNGQRCSRGGNQFQQNNYNQQRGHYDPQAANVTEQRPQDQPRNNNQQQPQGEEETNIS